MRTVASTSVFLKKQQTWQLLLHEELVLADQLTDQHFDSVRLCVTKQQQRETDSTDVCWLRARSSCFWGSWADLQSRGVTLLIHFSLTLPSNPSSPCWVGDSLKISHTESLKKTRNRSLHWKTYHRTKIYQNEMKSFWKSARNSWKNFNGEKQKQRFLDMWAVVSLYTCWLRLHNSC